MIFKHLVEWRRAAFANSIVCVRACVCVCVCVRGEKNLFSLFLARVKVTLFSPRGASLCGLNQSKFPLCFLLRGDTLLLSAGPLVTRSSAGP